ncbi:MAG: very short patch repair endonuclease [bacterium]|nr:very short patch repair endonuclease [bacterium]
MYLNSNKGYQYIRDGRAPIPKKEITSRIMSAIKAKNTKPELILRKALREAGLRGYRLHCKKVLGRPDICYLNKKIAIFVNGCYWHRCPYCNPSKPKTHIRFWSNKFRNNIERDKRKHKELKSLGWKVLTFWECQINKRVFKLVDKLMIEYNSR